MKSTVRPFEILLIWGLLAFAFHEAIAQTPLGQPSRFSALKDQQSITGGVGMTIIDGKPYYLFNLTPELSFGKIGVGLDINIRVGEDGKVRHEDFKDAYSYLRLIRYLRYGAKHEPLYARVGSLDYSRIGHGSIMYMYRNTASYDLRKVGVEFDADFQKVGFESMYSDVAGRGVLGLRGYARPLQFTDAVALPIIGGLEAGVTFASDLNANANQTWGDARGSTGSAQGGGALSVIGVDLGLPLLSHDVVHSTLYADYAKILTYGSGATVGINLELRGLGLVTFDAKYERRFVGDHFVPSYFDAFYERDRYQLLDTTRFISKAQMLKGAQSYDGYFGELLISILNTFNIVGGYQAPVGVPNGGTLHLELETMKALPGILFNAGYDKKNVGAIFKLDNNSLLYAQVGYQPMPYLVVSMLYQWTFSEVRDEVTGKVTGYEPQKRIEPRVGFVVHF
ncbi:MAG: hypothetical protein NTU47_06175 [Ignavibacteriales bacterium]|nr:hypothetical protein [Ignavibacteriales bacterium]